MDKTIYTKLFTLPGLIKKVKGTYRYYLTKLGKAVITTGLRMKNLFVVPESAGIQVASF